MWLPRAFLGNSVLALSPLMFTHASSTRSREAFMRDNLPVSKPDLTAAAGRQRGAMATRDNMPPKGSDGFLFSASVNLTDANNVSAWERV